MLPDVLFRCYKKDDGKIYWSLNEGGLAEQFGLTTKEIEGKSLHELFPGGASPELEAHFEAAFAGKPYAYTNEIEGRHFRHFPQPVYDDDGNVKEVVGFIADVTELVETQRRLELANEELEAFAYTASHDFRGPLSILMMDATMLSRRLEEGSKEAKAAQRIQNAADRLAKMVDGLLALSRAGRERLDIRNVNVTSIASDVAARLTRQHPERKAEWDIEEDMEIQADESLTEVLIQNLVENAWKFTSDEDTTRIRIGFGPEGTIEISDNGPGFTDEQAGTIFEAFTRLGRDKPGSGIGLATVKRIVERHNGTIEAIGVPGEGATFRFTLTPDS